MGDLVGGTSVNIGVTGIPGHEPLGAAQSVGSQRCGATGVTAGHRDWATVGGSAFIELDVTIANAAEDRRQHRHQCREGHRLSGKGDVRRLAQGHRARDFVDHLGAAVMACREVEISAVGGRQRVGPPLSVRVVVVGGGPDSRTPPESDDLAPAVGEAAERDGALWNDTSSGGRAARVRHRHVHMDVAVRCGRVVRQGQDGNTG